MSEPGNQEDREKAVAFFTRAEEAAMTKNFDYAIEMFLEGLRLEPDALEEGHLALRKLAFDRMERGGKKPSMVDKVKHRAGKGTLEDMISAEYLLARDPNNISFIEMLLKACIAGSYPKTGTWAAFTLFQTNHQKEKPSYNAYVLLKDAFDKFELYEEAIQSCKFALQLKPENAHLVDNIRDFSAKMTVKNGKYGLTEDFRDSIKDREGQEKIQSQENLIKSDQSKKILLEDAIKNYKVNPEHTITVLRLAEAYFDLDTDEGFKGAITVLQKTYEKTNDFTFKRRLGELQIRKLKTMLRNTKSAIDAKPENKQLKSNLDQILAKLSNLELEHYRHCVENYPTDIHMKYEYALRLLVNQQYDEALPLFQDAQGDPHHKLAAMDKTGLCFFFKGWYNDAIDIFKAAMDACEIAGSALGKDIRYNLARSYEESDQPEQAIEIFRKLAQLDFNYKDVAQRVDKLRKSKE
jgi:tetratricopeptide (TPR) repeat protein